MTIKGKSHCKFYITRHGETVWNTQKIMQGHLDSPLTKNGIKQAEETAQKLNSVKFDYAFSSDLMRAQKTAEIIVAGQDIVVETDNLLRESKLGPFEGKKLTVFFEQLKESITQRDLLASEEQMSFKIHPEVESYEEMAARMIKFLKKNARLYLGKNMLVVSHAGIIRATLVKLGFFNNETLSHGLIKNASYAVIESDGIGFFLKQTEGVGNLKEQIPE